LSARSIVGNILISMAGYSGTPLPRKLGLKPGSRFGALRAPDGFVDALGELPAGVSLETLRTGGRAARAARPFDVIVWFVRALDEVDRELAGLPARLAPAGGLWIAWPKRASGIPTDAGENEIRARGLTAGLVDNKVCAIDETWSGLRFVIRLADRKDAIGRAPPSRTPPATSQRRIERPSTRVGR
jgi:hypothetical protein